MGAAAGGVAVSEPAAVKEEEVDLAKLFKTRLKEQLARNKAILGTPAGKLNAAAEVIAAAPAAIEKIRSAPRRHRGFLAVREILRMTGRVLLPAAWPVIEMVGAGARRAVHDIKDKNRK